MSLGQEILAIGNQVWLCFEGTSFTSPTSGTASVTAKPDQAEATAWIKMGGAMVLDIGDAGGEEVEIYEPAPGRLQRTEILELKPKLDLSLTCTRVMPATIQMLLRTLGLSASGSNQQYNPLEGGTVKAWVKIQQYDQANVLRNTLDVWAKIKLNGSLVFDPSKPVEVKYDIKVLYSLLNSGKLI